MKWIKRIAIGLLLIVVVGGALTYVKLKEIGIIPRADYDTVAPAIPAVEVVGYGAAFQ